MNDTDATQLLLAIIKQAQEGNSLKFHYITSWSELIEQYRFHKSTCLVIKTLEYSANRLFKGYCKDVIAGISDVNKLLAYEELLKIIEFYKNDLTTIERMLAEYKYYLKQGNFLFSFLGGERDI